MLVYCWWVFWRVAFWVCGCAGAVYCVYGRRATMRRRIPPIDERVEGLKPLVKGKSLWTLPLAATSHPLARRATQSFGEQSVRLSRPGWCGRTCHRSPLPAGTSSQECSLLPRVPRRGCRSRSGCAERYPLRPGILVSQALLRDGLSSDPT